MPWCKYGGGLLMWYFRKMDSLAGQQLVKADGASVNADEVLADKVYFTLSDKINSLTDKISFFSNWQD